MSAANNAQSLRSFTSWKLDVVNTSNADPRLRKHSAAFRLLVLSLKFVREDNRTAYVTNTVARVQANIRSSETLATARKVLVETGYYRDTGQRTGDGAIIYEILNPRKEEVAVHVQLATESLKEQETFRKNEERRKDRVKQAIKAERTNPANDVASIIEDPKPTRRFDDRTDSASMIEDKHLELTPGDITHRAGGLRKRRCQDDPWGVMGDTLRPMSEVRR